MSYVKLFGFVQIFFFHFQICRIEEKFNNMVAFLKEHIDEKHLVFFRYMPFSYPVKSFRRCKVQSEHSN